MFCAIGRRRPKLTVFGRSAVLVVGELLANALCWILAGLLFGRKEETRDILSLCLLAWTLGLRHGLDADHISAIDNATRGLISLGQLPVTCGLFFSLGHSTIVIVVNVAIAISTDVYDKIGSIGDVGGIVGAAVSGSFLFIIGLANSIILWQILRRRRRAAQVESGHPERDSHHNQFLMMRLLGPVTRFVNRPWKMYPVGVLFGFGFDTASSIALLAVSALAKRDANGRESIASGNIIMLPLLFTAGMTLVDSLDSVLMLYSYAGLTEKGFSLFERRPSLAVEDDARPLELPGENPEAQSPPSLGAPQAIEGHPTPVDGLKPPEPKPSKSLDDAVDGPPTALDRAKQNTLSQLSIILTLISILVAFSISLITIMGLIGENCRSCRDAAKAEDGGGLAGKWWRGWAKANDQSGFIGAAIVGCFAAIVFTYYAGQWFSNRRHRCNSG